MRRLAASFIALAALAIAISLMLLPTSDGPSPLTGPGADQEGSPKANETRLPDFPQAAQPKPTRDSLPETAAQGVPTVHLLGQVIDTSAHPIAGASIRLYAVGEPWLETGNAPGDAPNLATETDGLGHFEITVPLPTAEWVDLRVRAGAFHTTAQRSFRKTGRSGNAPLVAGDMDLGEFVLQEAGVLEGRVIDASGIPIDRALISSTTGSSTDDLGRYRVEGVDVGPQSVSAYKRGFRDGPAVDVDIIASTVTQVPDLILELAPTLEGRVVDEDGAPLADVQLRAWPDKGGSGSSAQSDVHGAFSLPMPEDRPYRIMADREGYLPLPLWGSDSPDTKSSLCLLDGKPCPAFATATRGIEIRLLRAEQVTFHVVAASDGQSIQRFGLATDAVRVGGGVRNSRVLSSELAIEQHPNGTAVLPGNESEFDYAVAAPGFGPQTGRVVFDPGTEGEVTLRLAAAARIEGRLVRDGQGVPMPTIAFSRTKLLPSDLGSGDHDYRGGSRYWSRGEADGRFALNDLAAGTYQLVLRADGVAPITLDKLDVGVGATLDLGNIEASSPGRILGRVIGAPSVEGLTVSIGGPLSSDPGTALLTTRNGTFGFEGLAEGDHWVWVEAKPGILAEDISRKVHLGPGEERKLQINLAPSAPYSIEARVLINDEPRAGLIVFAATSTGDHFPSIGTTDSAGVVRGEIPPVGAFQLDVRNDRLLFVGLDDEVRTAIPGGALSVELALQPGKLSIMLPFEPEHLTEPRMQSTLSFISRSGYPLPCAARIDAADWVSSDDFIVAPIGLTMPGIYDLALITRIGRYEGTVEVRAGEPALAELTQK